MPCQALLNFFHFSNRKNKDNSYCFHVVGWISSMLNWSFTENFVSNNYLVGKVFKNFIRIPALSNSSEFTTTHSFFLSILWWIQSAVFVPNTFIFWHSYACMIKIILPFQVACSQGPAEFGEPNSCSWLKSTHSLRACRLA